MARSCHRQCPTQMMECLSWSMPISTQRPMSKPGLEIVVRHSKCFKQFPPLFGEFERQRRPHHSTRCRIDAHVPTDSMLHLRSFSKAFSEEDEDRLLRHLPCVAYICSDECGSGSFSNWAVRPSLLDFSQAARLLLNSQPGKEAFIWTIDAILIKLALSSSLHNILSQLQQAHDRRNEYPSKSLQVSSERQSTRTRSMEVF